MPVRLSSLGSERFYDTRDVKVAELEAIEKTAKNIQENQGVQVSADNFEVELEVLNMGGYYTHHVTVTGLDPETGYSFLIGDRLLYRKVKDADGNDVITTLKVPEAIEAPIPAYGTVKDAQNMEDISWDDLLPITDGVVYFNYLDELTEERSSVFSGPLSEEGNWYIDVSKAVDSEGVHFLKRPYDMVTNILVELVIDGGASGRWKKVFESNTSAPADTIVINDPLSTQDEKVGITRLDLSLSKEFVMGVEASDSGVKFAAFCGPCYRNSLKEEVPCPKDILDHRGCKKGAAVTMQEAISAVDHNSCGGIPVDTYVWGGSTFGCRYCSRIVKTDALFKDFDTTKLVPADASKCGFAPSAPEEEEPIDGVELGKPACGTKTRMSKITDTDKGTWCKTGIVVPGSIVVSKPSGETHWDCKLGDERVSCSASLEGARAPGGGTEDSKVPKCGTKAGTYRAKDLGWNPFAGWCSHGDVENIRPNPTFPPKGMTATWNCTLGDKTVECSASRDIGEDQRIVNVCSEGSGGDVCTMPDGKRGVCVALQSPTLRRCVVPGTKCSSNVGEHIGGDMFQWNYMGFCVLRTTDFVKALVAQPKFPNQKCDAKLCNCISGAGGLITGFLEQGEYCPMTLLCTPLTDVVTDEVVCSKDRNKHVCKGFNCVPAGSGGVTENRGEAQRDSSPLDFMTPVYAAEEYETADYIVDAETGVVAGLVEGMYTFEYEGETYSFFVSPDQQKGVKVYVDKNDNDQFDQGTDVLISEFASKIKVITLGRTYKYELREGFNAVSFPFLLPGQENRSAAGLLKTLNKNYESKIFSIAKFNGSTWQIVGENTIPYSNNDFQILPGVGYIIKASDSVNITIEAGRPVKYESSEDSAPINLFEGWNLVGIYGTGVKAYTAKSMISDINASNFTADNVSKWAKEKQMYDGFQVSEGKEYSFDFPINPLESVFVRILKGRGVWQPKLRAQ